MAFGQSRQQEAKKVAAGSTENSGSGLEWPFIPIKGGNNGVVKGGIRKIRLLPKIENGELVTVPATNKAGKVIPGKLVTVPDDEVRFVEIWLQCMVNGEEKPKRIWIDWQGDGRWKSPYWLGIEGVFVGAKNTDKEKRAMREHFAINVIDRTPVIFDDKGYPVYSDENGKFCITALGQRLDKAVEGEPQPLDRVRILEGTSGRTDPPGKHFFQQFVNLMSTVEDGDGQIRQLHEFDIMIKTTGANKETTRSALPTANFKPLSDDLVFAPRYDLATYFKPYPHEAVEALLRGEDYNAVVEQFGIVTIPELVAVRGEEVEIAAPVKNRKKAKVEEDSEELFD